MAPDPARRRANAERVVADLYRMFDAGVVAHFEQVERPGNTPTAETRDAWVVRFANGYEREYSFSQAKALTFGYDLGMQVGTAAPAAAKATGG